MDEGRSLESFGKVANCGPRTLYDWLKKYPEFKEAHERGYSGGVYQVETAMLEFEKGEAPEGAKPVTAIFRAKTRFHKVYQEPKQKVELEASLSLEQLIAQAATARIEPKEIKELPTPEDPEVIEARAKANEAALDRATTPFEPLKD